MKQKMKQRIWSTVLLVAMLLSLIPSSISFAKQEDFSVDLTYGYGNGIQVGAYVPFFAQVTNNGKDFNGMVQIIVPGRDGHNTLYEKEISIAAGATKTITLTADIETNLKKVNVRIANRKDKVVWNQEVRCTVLTSMNTVNIGILSDDYSALGYMDRQAFIAYPAISTRICELGVDTFPDDFHALDMLKVIVISDFSTDLLSDAQISALSMWVDEGGLLIVGTGSTASKTLAKLNGNLFSVTPGDLSQQNTKFGLTLNNYVYTYVDDYGYSYDYNSSYTSDEEYGKYFEENYESIKPELESEYLEEFKEYYGYDETYDTWDEYYEDAFYSYCYENFYYDYYSGIAEQNQAQMQSVIDSFPYVKADVLEYELGDKDEAASSAIFGESSSNKSYVLGNVIASGEGYTVLAAVDFTKTPLSSYEGNKLFFTNIVESLIGSKCYQEFQEYSSSYSYYGSYYGSGSDYKQENLFNQIGTAPLPPLLIYLAVIGLYLIAILVLYIVFRKKKKSMKLWIWYPLVAAGVGIMVFCIGFSTRLLRPVVNVGTIIDMSNSSIKEENIVAVTIPRNREYKIGFSNQYAMEYKSFDYDYYYGDEEDIDYNSYDIGFQNTIDGTRVRLCNLAALDKANFYLKKVYRSEREVGFSLTEKSVNDITITNNYGCTLENAFIYYDGNIYRIGEMKDGSSVKLGSISQDNIFTYPYYYVNHTSVTGTSSAQKGLEDAIFPNKSMTTLMAIAFGSLFSNFDEYSQKMALLSYFEEEYIDYYTYAYNYSSTSVSASDYRLFFCGFTTEQTAGEIQSDSNFRENRAEMVVVSTDYTSLSNAMQN